MTSNAYNYKQTSHAWAGIFAFIKKAYVHARLLFLVLLRRIMFPNRHMYFLCTERCDLYCLKRRIRYYFAPLECLSHTSRTLENRPGESKFLLSSMTSDWPSRNCFSSGTKTFCCLVYGHYIDVFYSFLIFFSVHKRLNCEYIIDSNDYTHSRRLPYMNMLSRTR